MKRTPGLHRVAAILGALALFVTVSCSRVAEDCQLNVTCADDGVKAAGGGGGRMTSTSASGGGSGASSSTGVAVMCEEGDLVECYEGPAGTLGKGLCLGGKQLCLAEGTPAGPCMGQVLPAPENCASAADEDCNGASAMCTGMTQSGNGFGASVTNEVVFAVAADASGNILLGGSEGVMPNGQLTYSLSSGAGLVTKLSPSGVKLWSKSVIVGANGNSVVRSVATDAAGDVLVLGEYQGLIAGGDLLYPPSNGVDIFLFKLDPSGAVVWQKWFGGSNGQYPTALSLDSSGNIFLTGSTYGPIDFGGGQQPVAGSADVFVAKLDKDGNHLWSKLFGDSTGQFGYGVAATPDGDAVITGYLGGTMTFGSKTLVSAGGSDVYIAKLDGSTGSALWAQRYGDSDNQKGTSVAVDKDGSVVVTGSMVGHCDFGGADLYAHASADAFVVKLKADGSHVWSHSYGDTTENQVGLGVTIDPAQNIVAVGYFKGTMAFGATTLIEAPMSNPSNTDLFVGKLAADGSTLWARSFGDPGDQAAWAVATDASASVIVGGDFQGTVSLPPSIVSTGNYDSLWLKLAP